MRKVIEADFDAVIAINQPEVEYTSRMNKARLCHLNAISDYHKVATVDNEAAAFLLAMKDGCGYVNANFEWFAARFDAFMYIDRIVVGSNYRRLGLGTLLYRDLFDYARSADISTIACEYNVVPLNETSRAFHEGFGFREVGRQWLDAGAKQVSLQVTEI